EQGHAILTKPGNRENAEQQLARCSGQTVTFWTGLALINRSRNRRYVAAEPFSVRFRQLTTRQIERYIELDNPLDCAGSFKSEGLGICLFDRFEGRDPNTLVGLPLMMLCDFLAAEGIQLPL
ncbi:MAG TPA: Maf family protein, partial [Pseudomonadales bacterium]|nr:Maf family protein [Pseudomonadales bacterium]